MKAMTCQGLTPTAQWATHILHTEAREQPTGPQTAHHRGEFSLPTLAPTAIEAKNPAHQELKQLPSFRPYTIVLHTLACTRTCTQRHTQTHTDTDTDTHTHIISDQVSPPPPLLPSQKDVSAYRSSWPRPPRYVRSCSIDCNT